MYLPIPSQLDCAAAWREAVRRVDAQPGHAAYNVVIDVEDPTANADLQDARVRVVNQFLDRFGKSVETVANTIFPAGLYYRYGAPAFFKVFDEMVLPKVRRNNRWSGYYFERMTHVPAPNGKPINQLWGIIENIRDGKFRALNKFELSVFDPARDIDGSPRGGQCLSFASFKLTPGTNKKLLLTVMYRNHFYIEKLLGNLIGLGRLMAFVGREANVAVGPLTVVSTHAEIDKPGEARRLDIERVLKQFDDAANAQVPA